MRATVLLPRRGLMALAISAALVLLAGFGAAPAAHAAGSVLAGELAQESLEPEGVQGEGAGPVAVLYSALNAPIMRAEVPLAFGGAEPEPLTGSFVDGGMAFALLPDGTVSLVTASAEAAEGEGRVVVPAAASHGGASYEVASVSGWAFSLVEAASVELPASIESVSLDAFRGSSVAAVEVDPENPTLASFDGSLWDAGLTSLLLIPEGKQGTARIPETAEEVAASAFSHCAGVTALSVDAGSAAFASENGLLYDAGLTTLLRVPAGATEITIHDGCTTVAAGSMEGCAALERIAAPATVASVAPGLLAASGSPESLLPAAALEKSDATVPEVDAASIEVAVTDESLAASWEAAGFSTNVEGDAVAGLSQSSDAYGEYLYTGYITIYTAGGTLTWTDAGNGSGSNSYGTRVEFIRNWSVLSTGAIHIGTNTASGFQAFSVSRVGYTFAGWAGYALGTSYVGTDDATFTATWTPNTYTVTYNGAGGTVWGVSSWTASNPSMTFGTGSWNVMAVAVRTGYTFLGYYTAASGGTQVYDANGACTNEGTYYSNSLWCYPGDMTFYAHWKGNAYTVSFNANGGSGGQSANVTATYGSAMPAISTTKPTRAGYTFGGWYDATSGGTQYYTAAGASARSWNKTSNATLYARWTANTISCSFNPNGGTLSNGSTATATFSTTYASGKTLGDLWWQSPWRTGYAFKGWFTAASGGTQVFSTTALPTANATYYAQWSPNAITITWDSCGGSLVPDTEATYSSSGTVSLPDEPSYPGRVFAGWWTAPTGGTQVTSSTALPASNATYYAHWTLEVYRITYDLDGGTATGNPASYDATTATFELTSPQRIGYAFAGWSGTGLSGDANMTVVVEQGSLGDRSYQAHWTPSLSADVPLKVVARVDLLGVEEQVPGDGYIESRCGEPLTVDTIGMEPLPGAEALFGAANTSSVLMSITTGSTAAPQASFALDAVSSQTDPGFAVPFRMNAYGDRLPIAYRFDIPDDVLFAIAPGLFEGVTTPVCSVAYTVALA